jgi:hypothetical protein
MIHYNFNHRRGEVQKHVKRACDELNTEGMEL